MLSIFFLLSCVVVNHSLAEYDPTTHPNWHLLQNPYCDGNTNSRIVGGHPAGSREFPWIAGLIAISEQTGLLIKYTCGGSVLNERIILTAAHCVDNQKMKDETGMEWGERVVKVAIGDYNLDTSECDFVTSCGKELQIIDVDEIIVHDSWEPDSGKNDIALIRLAKDIQYNSHARPVCLPRGRFMRETFRDFDAKAAGWGMTDKKTATYSDILLKIFLRVQDNSRCSSKIFDGNLQLCVASTEEGARTCKGDSGGPLMIVDRFNREPVEYMIGIVSYDRKLRRKACSASRRYGIYTRVTAYMPWILDNLA